MFGCFFFVQIMHCFDSRKPVVLNTRIQNFFLNLCIFGSKVYNWFVLHFYFSVYTTDPSNPQVKQGYMQLAPRSEIVVEQLWMESTLNSVQKKKTGIMLTM